MRYRWTTVYRNGEMVQAQLSADREWLRGLIEDAAVDARYWRQGRRDVHRDTNIISTQLHARTYGQSRGNVRRRDGVEKLAGVA